jgi:hypothetical protein
MVAFSKSWESICLQLKSTRYEQLPASLQREVDRFSLAIEKYLRSGGTPGPLPSGMLALVFDFRIKALRWLETNQERNMTSIADDLYPQIAAWNNKPEMEVLRENVLFAIRCNQRVLNAFLESGTPPEGDKERIFSNLPEIRYEQYLASLSLAGLDAAQTQRIIDWSHASLSMEFGMIAADLVVHGNFPTHVVDGLAAFVARVSQEYVALAHLLHILKREPDSPHLLSYPLGDPESMQEEKDLADLGLDDYAAQLSEE